MTKYGRKKGRADRLLWAVAVTAAWLTVPVPYAEGQSNIGSDHKYVWGENVGWTNWRDANGGLRGVAVEETHLSGFIWAENVGWLNVGDGTPEADCDGLPCYANIDGADAGVNVHPITGEVFGLAWGENVGWINFSAGALADPPIPARLVSEDGITRFRGFAWGENVGWVNLDDDAHFVGIVSDAAIVDVQSVRIHGNIALSIDLDDANGIEPRFGGVQELRIQMSLPMEAATVTCGNVGIACAGEQLACALAELAEDQQTVIVSLAGQTGSANCCKFAFDGMSTASGGSVVDDYAVTILEGDLNFSGGVTGGDAALIKPHFGEIAGVDLSEPWWDFDVSGGVTGGDFALIKTRFNNVAPACP